MAATQAFSSMGTVIQLEVASVFHTIIEMADITTPDGEPGLIPVTRLDSPDGRAEFVAGIVDEGNVVFSGNFIPSDTYHQALFSQKGATNNWKIISSDAGGATWAFAGILTKNPVVFSVGQQAKISLNVKVTGTVTFTP